MAERDQFSAGVGSGIYGSGESVGNIVFPPTPSGLTGGAPAAPANLVASNGEYTDKILLTWGIVSGATKYKIYRNLNLLLETTGTPDTNNNISYDDTSAVPGTLYTYVVTAVNNTGESSQSNSDTGSRKLSVPSSISVSQNTYKNKINLSWSSVDGAESYLLYRSVDNSTDNMIFLVETVDTHYTDINAPGVYYYYSIISSSDNTEANSDYSTPSYGIVDPIPETPIVTATKGTYSDKIELTWNTITTANSYDIYRDSSLIESTVATMYSDTTASPGVSHTYYVLANSSTGTSIYTTDSGDTGSRQLEFPNGVIASNELYENKITVSWNQTTGATGYKIYRGTSPVNPGLNMTLIATVNSSTFSYDDTNTDLLYAVNYYYCIKAFCTLAEDESDFSSPALGILQTPTPAQPTGLSASQGTYSDKVSLTWNAVTNASSYLIYRDGVQIATSTTNSYDDTTGATSYCQSYTYYVESINNFGNISTASSSVTGYKALQTPTGLTATDSQFLSKIVVTWNAVPAATSYTLYRGITSSTGSMSIIASGLTSPSYDDTNTDLTYGTRYYYSVKATCALNTTGFSSVDARASGILDTPTVVIPAPNTPTGLTASDGSSTTQVALTWTSVTSTPLTGYKIFRNGTQIGTSTLTSFSDTPALGAVPGTQYTYTVKAYNTYGDSSASSSDTGYMKLTAPTGLSASRGISESTIALNWNASQGATSYKIYRSSDAITYSQIDTTTSTNYNDTNTDLSYDTVYYYKLKASGSLAAAESAYGNPYYGYLKPPVPQSFTMTASDGTDSSGVILSWTSSQHAYGGYKIYRDGVPIADARANYFKYSSTLDRLATGLGWSSYTTPGGGSGQLFATSSKVMPDSSTNGTKITFATDANNGFYQQIPSVEENTYYIASIYAGTESGSTNFRISYFDGTTSTFSDPFTATTIMQRFSWTFKTALGKTEAQKFLSNVAFGNVADTGGTVVFWGAQLEKVESVSDTVSSYITTTTTPVIRTTHTDTTANIETIYTYKIKALNASGSIESNTNTGFRLTPAPVITNITKTDTSKIDLTITTNASTSSTLKIYRGVDSNTNDSTNTPNYAEIASIAVTGATMTYSDTTSLQTGKKYYYRARTVYNSANSDYSNEEYGMITSLSAPTGPQDYAVWAISFVPANSGSARAGDIAYWSGAGANPNNCMFKYSGSDIIYNTDYRFKAIVSSVNPPVNTGDPSFNGQRHWTSTIYNPSNTDWTSFKNLMSAIPSGRRPLSLYQWWLDVGQLWVKTLLDHYKDNTSDGTTYTTPTGSKRFITPWLDNQYADASSHFSGFVQKCKNEGLVFDYMLDNKERLRTWYLNFGYNTDVVGSLFGDGRSNYGSNNSQMTSDSRIISAMVEDPRITTKINPVTGKTFAQEFLANFIELWNADPFYGGAVPPKPIPVGPPTAQYPSGKPLEWTDLVQYIFTETTREKNLPFTDKLCETQVTSYPTATRIRTTNIWNTYSCSTGVGTQEYGQFTFNGKGCGSCSIKGSENWLLNRYGNHYKNLTVNQGGTTLSTPDNDLGTWYDNWVNPTVPGNPKLTGYAMYHFVANAWDATCDSWIYNYYIRSMFMNPLKDTNSPQFNNTKYITYEMAALNANETVFNQESNSNRFFRKTIDQYGGEQLYGAYTNVLYHQYPITYSALILNVRPDQLSGSSRTSISDWKTTNSYRSGYVKSPQSDHERYSWAGYGVINYGGPSACTSNLIRYPEIPLLDASDNWLGTTNKNKWLIELVYKIIVNDLMRLRFFLRSSDYFVPWPIMGPIGVGSSSTVNFQHSGGYWFEMMFHCILNTKEAAIPVYTSAYTPNSIGTYDCVQAVFDEWRTVSTNRKPLPCSNTTGNSTLPVDRIILEDAFEKCLISGGKLGSSNNYIWRITVPPKFFDAVTGIAVLDRVGNDSDIPATITIDSKKDVIVAPYTNTMNSRGAWVTRSVATPPSYIPRPV